MLTGQLVAYDLCVIISLGLLCCCCYILGWPLQVVWKRFCDSLYKQPSLSPSISGLIIYSKSIWLTRGAVSRVKKRKKIISRASKRGKRGRKGMCCVIVLLRRRYPPLVVRLYKKEKKENDIPKVLYLYVFYSRVLSCRGEENIVLASLLMTDDIFTLFSPPFSFFRSSFTLISCWDSSRRFLPFFFITKKSSKREKWRIQQQESFIDVKKDMVRKRW